MIVPFIDCLSLTQMSGADDLMQKLLHVLLGRFILSDSALDNVVIQLLQLIRSATNYRRDCLLSMRARLEHPALIHASDVC
jgi:hypothetical protein